MGVVSLKHHPSHNIALDASSLFSILRRRRTKVFIYGFMFAFVACTAYMAFCPAGEGSPRFNEFYATATASTAPYRSQISSFFSRFFPYNTSPSQDGHPGSRSQGGIFDGNRTKGGSGSREDGLLGGNQTRVDGLVKNQTSSGVGSGDLTKNETKVGTGPQQNATLAKNHTSSGDVAQQNGILAKNQTMPGVSSKQSGTSASQTSVSSDTEKGKANQGSNKGKGAMAPMEIPSKEGSPSPPKSNDPAPVMKNLPPPASLAKGDVSPPSMPPKAASKDNQKKSWSVESMKNCDIFDGTWVEDDSYPLYKEGSCPHIDEPFDCFRNGRPDRSYQKLRWQPNGCNIPRLNATDMLERLRGKRLVFVGDSLNRNMWESLVCVLKNSVKDKKKVFEASGRHEFRTEGSYSFLFKDYDCTVEFFRSPFLVQEWEIPNTNGTKKETLRLDIIERSSSKYRDADIIVFNTGHWWTHDKTSRGKDYYQEGNRVYSELNVVEAFHKALNTWAKWVDVNINPQKSLVFFRGYSASHFRGGQWNSGGQCDAETEPITNEKFLSSYPPKMNVLESVLKGMKTRVSYLNITRMTDYRKDAHPSIYRKQKLTEAERRSPDRYQDCSHWCLPGVPDSWNELLYAQLLINQHKPQ